MPAVQQHPQYSKTSELWLQRRASRMLISIASQSAGVSAIVLAVLFGLLLTQAATSAWRQGARSSIALRAVHRTQTEAPDNAAVAVCTIMKITPDDPQWVGGHAEDLHEVCYLIRKRCGNAAWPPM